MTGRKREKKTYQGGERGGNHKASYLPTEKTQKKRRKSSVAGKKSALGRGPLTAKPPTQKSPA